MLDEYANKMMTTGTSGGQHFGLGYCPHCESSIIRIEPDAASCEKSHRISPQEVLLFRTSDTLTIRKTIEVMAGEVVVRSSGEVVSTETT